MTNVTLPLGRLWHLAHIAVLALPLSCKKHDQSTPDRPSQSEQFFKTTGTVNPVVLKVIENLKKQNDKTGFIDAFVDQHGVAIWDKAIVSSQRTLARTSIKNDDYTIIPLQFPAVKKVHGALICKVNSSDSVVAVRLVDARKYQNWDTVLRTDEATAFQASLLMMQLNKEVFGTTRFVITDSISLRGKSTSKTVRSVSNGSSASEFRLEVSTVQICVTVLVPNQNGQLTGCPATEPDCPQYHEELVCESYNIWYDDDNGGGGTTNPDGGPGGVDGSTHPCSPLGGTWIHDGVIGPACGSGSGSGSGSIGYTPYLTPLDEPLPKVVFDYDDLSNPVNALEYTYLDPAITLDTLPGLAPFGRSVGRTVDRKNTEDMTHGYDGDSTGIAYLPMTVSGLFNEMEDLFDATTALDGEMRIVADEMRSHFRYGNGELYESTLLNRKVKESATFQAFAQRFAKNIDNVLIANGNDGSTFEINDVLYHPVFDGFYHKFHGLQITINDTEQTKMYMRNFQVNSNGTTWSADITFVIRDHFGLDKHDALLYQGKHNGFAAWWLLQHRRNYKPFETLITIQHRVTFNR